jgi:iron(II)-dependent oxidoreductase
MARFPVTVAQWREYVARSDESPNDEDSLRGRHNEPVVWVDWHAALRFCNFHTEAWRGLLPEGWIVTLPSEAEWEKAARGGEGNPAKAEWVTVGQVRDRLEAPVAHDQVSNPFPARDFPWGQAFDADKANVGGSIGEASAVGAYPTGDSPYGCEEMSGNVWEWTRSLWGEGWEKPDFVYPYDPADAAREALEAPNDILRVVRGGSWRSARVNAGCAFRFGVPPDSRHFDLGFRVVLRSAPVASGL